MKKIFIIGGGPSGLVSAIECAKKGNDVTILERNPNLGKKLLLTGNGKCNFWNTDQTISHYHSSNLNELQKIITKENINKVESFWQDLKLIVKNKNNYLYPNSNESSTILAILVNECKRLNVKIITNTRVNNITKDNNKFIIDTNKEQYTGDIVVISTGSKSYPKTGSEGLGYLLAQNFGHTIISPTPGLVQLTSVGYFLKDWQGIRTDVKITLLENKNIIKEELGEIQLTNYGISGICVFNMSSYVSIGLNENKKETIMINFLPMFKNRTALEKYIFFNNNLKIGEILQKGLNQKLVNILLDICKITPSSTWDDLSEIKKTELLKTIINFKLDITGTLGFDNSQVTVGGIPLTEINVKTMESKLINNLYFTGEILDCNGDCGGYNLGFAWISGLLMGGSLK